MLCIKKEDKDIYDGIKNNNQEIINSLRQKEKLPQAESRRIEDSAIDIININDFKSYYGTKLLLVAEWDYICFRHLCLLEYTFPLTVFAASQAVEKYLKGILLREKHPTHEKSHNIKNLWECVLDKIDFFSSRRVELKEKYDKNIEKISNNAHIRYMASSVCIDEFFLYFIDDLIGEFREYCKNVPHKMNWHEQATRHIFNALNMQPGMIQPLNYPMRRLLIVDSSINGELKLRGNELKEKLGVKLSNEDSNNITLVGAKEIVDYLNNNQMCPIDAMLHR